ncbi:hypothetical protein AUK22_11150 [bacterium CG2_30_54_10]|nr:MAG: hypothetical protein AUK22_11150 [bacterium CG2_30_54_10]
MTKPLCTKAVAEFLGVSPVTVRTWVAEGSIPHYRIGKLLRYDEKDIAAWLNTKRFIPARMTAAVKF